MAGVRMDNVMKWVGVGGEELVPITYFTTRREIDLSKIFFQIPHLYTVM